MDGGRKEKERGGGREGQEWRFLFALYHEKNKGGGKKKNRSRPQSLKRFKLFRTGKRGKQGGKEKKRNKYGWIASLSITVSVNARKERRRILFGFCSRRSQFRRGKGLFFGATEEGEKKERKKYYALPYLLLFYFTEFKRKKKERWPATQSFCPLGGKKRARIKSGGTLLWSFSTPSFAAPSRKEKGRRKKKKREGDKDKVPRNNHQEKGKKTLAREKRGKKKKSKVPPTTS